LAGEERLGELGREARWRRDEFRELHNDDALWAYAIRAHFEWEAVRRSETDPVLLRLLHMGIHDWTGSDDRLHQATQAMRHSTAMATRLLSRIRTLEEKVTPFPLSVL